MKNEKSKPNDKPKTINITEKAIKALSTIADKEPEFFLALTESICQIANTYSDKYEGAKELLDTKAQLYHPKRGAAINSYQISRYLQRFMSEGYEKSANKSDTLKMIHYCLFDVVRMNRMDNIKNSDIVDKASEKEFTKLGSK